MVHHLMPGPVQGMLPDVEADIGIVGTLETYRHGVAHPVGLCHVGATVKGIDTVGHNGPSRRRS